MTGQFSGLELSIGSVRGTRSFKVDALGRLTGVSYERIWTPGENVALCVEDDYRSKYGRYGYGSVLHTYTTTPSQTYTPPPRNGGTWNIFKKDAPTPPGTPLQESLGEPEIPKHNMAECSCGFHGYHDGSTDYMSSAQVTGVVEGYGEIVIGTRGFRALKARILALWIHDKDTPDSEMYVLTPAQRRRVMHNYSGIPFLSSLEQLLREYPVDGESILPTPETDPEFWTRSI
jgi:hypothetical protein